VADAAAEPEAAAPPQVYIVKPGDTLSGIAQRFGVGLKALLQANQISDPNLLQVGQKLRIPTTQSVAGPDLRLLPDSEFVYGPAYVDFGLTAFCTEQGGYLASYQEKVSGQLMSGPEIVRLVAHHYSVGPRLLLAILELKSGWVTDPQPTGNALSYPMGYKGASWERLYWQLAWSADQLNNGYYGWRGRGMPPLTWRDGSVTRLAATLNAGTAGLQYYLAQNAGKNQWQTWVGEGPGSFLAAYRKLFGDPANYAIQPLIANDLEMPTLTFPWPQGEMWYYTGGPHGAWENGSAWAALDFVPAETGLGCRPASSWATAAAAGLVIHSQDGEVLVDLDGDGYEQTGWVLYYLHIAAKGRVAAGTWVRQGDKIGHPSCEGGISDATHLHFARRYNGEWIAADGPLPLILSGWQAHSSGKAYDGTMTRRDQVRTACECREPDYNGLQAGR